MFDVGFSELMLIGIVALVVIGPERLPKVARTVGHLLGRMQRYVSDVKSDISREMQLDELKKVRTDVTDAARNFEMNILGEMKAVEATVGQHAQSAQEALQSLSKAVGEVAPGGPESSSVSVDAVPPAPALGEEAMPVAPAKAVESASPAQHGLSNT